MDQKANRRHKVRLVSKRINYINIAIFDKIISCAIINMSNGGVMIKLPDDMHNLPIEYGTPITFVNTTPPYSDLLEKKQGIIVWFQQGFCGISFNEELPCTTEELQALLNSN